MIVHKKVDLFCAACLLFLLCPPTAYPAADYWGTLREKTGTFYEAEGKVMELAPSQAGLIVNEKQIDLFDEVNDGCRLRTMIFDETGKPVSSLSTLLHKRVFVRGFEQRDGSVIARDIHVVGRDAGNRSVRRTIPDWNPVCHGGPR